MVKIIIKKLIKSNFKTDKLVSCSLFRQLTVDKDPIKYYNWLRVFVKNINRYYEDFKIRVYTDLSIIYNEDESIYEEGVKLLKELKRNSKVEVFMYRCNDFALNKYYHQGTFGSLVRLLPMFNKNKYKLVWVSDLDLSITEIKNFKKNIDIFEKNKYELMVISQNCYPKYWIPKENKFKIINYQILSKIKYPKELLFDFLEDIKNNKYNKIINKIAEKRRTKNKKTLMPYGIDEYFTNVILYDYIIQNKIKVMIQNNIMIKNLINRLYYSKIIKNQDSSKENMIKLSKMVLKNKNKLIKKYPKIDKRFFTTCPQQFLDNLDKVDNNYIYITHFN